MRAMGPKGRAAIVLWLPVLIPLVSGMLRGGGNGFWTYLACAPIVPGWIVPTWLRLDDALWFVVAGLTTVLGWFLTALASQRLPRSVGVVVEVVVFVAVGFAAIAFAKAVLM